MPPTATAPHPAAQAIGDAHVARSRGAARPGARRPLDGGVSDGLLAVTSLSRAVSGGARVADVGALMWMVVRQVLPCDAMAIFLPDERGRPGDGARTPRRGSRAAARHSAARQRHRHRRLGRRQPAPGDERRARARPRPRRRRPRARACARAWRCRSIDGDAGRRRPGALPRASATRSRKTTPAWSSCSRRAWPRRSSMRPRRDSPIDGPSVPFRDRGLLKLVKSS